jgi:RNA polymerase sigma-70 factor (ECF subfamily)
MRPVFVFNINGASEYMQDPAAMEQDSKLIAAVLNGDTASFEPLIAKYQPRIFGTARRYARRESEVEDIVQEVFIKAFQRLSSYRGEAPFEHWLMKLAVRTCYDFLRVHQRSRETILTELTTEEHSWLERCVQDSAQAKPEDTGARELVQRALAMLPAPARLVLTLLEIEERPVKEIAELTGWSVPLVKVRAFRARREMRKIVEKLLKQTNL